MQTVTIAYGTPSVDYTFDSYASAAQAVARLVGSFTAEATAFLALSEDEQEMCLVTATRLIDAQLYQGEAAGDDHAFPRSGLTDAEGDAVSETWEPVDQCIDLAAAIAAKPTIASASAGSNIQSMSAGPASITFFAPVAGGQATLLDTLIGQLFGPYLAGAGASIPLGMSFTGTGADSEFDDCGDNFELREE